jgi:hypothetical protein
VIAARVVEVVVNGDRVRALRCRCPFCFSVHSHAAWRTAAGIETVGVPTCGTPATYTAAVEDTELVALRQAAEDLADQLDVTQGVIVEGSWAVAPSPPKG